MSRLLNYSKSRDLTSLPRALPARADSRAGDLTPGAHNRRGLKILAAFLQNRWWRAKQETNPCHKRIQLSDRLLTEKDEITK